MSALPSKTDIPQHCLDVRFGPEPDSCTAAKASLFHHLVDQQLHRFGDRETGSLAVFILITNCRRWVTGGALEG